MTDLLVTLGSGGGDIALGAGDLAVDSGLRTAVLLSLFSDARSPADLTPPETDDRRGYWGEAPGDPYGSLLWLLKRSPATQATALAAEDYVRTALDWMVQDGIAETVGAVATFDAQSRLCVAVNIKRGSDRLWDHLWEGEQRHQFEGDGILVTIEGTN